MKQVSATRHAHVRTWFHGSQAETYAGQATRASDGVARASLLFKGTLNATVTANTPKTYAVPPAKNHARPGSSSVPTQTMPTTTHRMEVPKNTRKKTGFRILTLIRCMASMPRSGPRSPNARMATFENTKKSPAMSPDPTAAAATAYDR